MLQQREPARGAGADRHGEGETYRALMCLRRRGDLVLGAHRLGAVVGADSIYVFEHSRIPGPGHHEQLLELAST